MYLPDKFESDVGYCKSEGILGIISFHDVDFFMD